MTSVWPQIMSRGHTKAGWKFPFIITTEVSVSNNFGLYILPYCDLICLETSWFIFLVVREDLEEEFCVPMTSVCPRKMSRGHMKVVFIIYFSTLIFLYFLGIISIEIMQENTSRNNFTQKCHCFESLNAGKYSKAVLHEAWLYFDLYILPYCDLICLETWRFIFLVVRGDLEEEFCAPMTSNSV